MPNEQPVLDTFIYKELASMQCPIVKNEVRWKIQLYSNQPPSTKLMYYSLSSLPPSPPPFPPPKQI